MKGKTYSGVCVGIVQTLCKHGEHVTRLLLCS